MNLRPKPRRLLEENVEEMFQDTVIEDDFLI